MLMKVSSFWLSVLPASLIDFFYSYTVFFVLGVWLLFLGCRLFYRKLVFHKTLLFPFLLVIGLYTVVTFFDSVNYVLLLFQDPQSLWGSLEGMVLPDSSPFYADAGGHIFWDEQVYFIEETIYWQTASSVPVFFSCLFFYVLFFGRLLKDNVAKGRRAK